MTGKFTQAAQTFNYSNAKGAKYAGDWLLFSMLFRKKLPVPFSQSEEKFLLLDALNHMT